VIHQVEIKHKGIKVRTITGTIVLLFYLIISPSIPAQNILQKSLSEALDNNGFIKPDVPGSFNGLSKCFWISLHVLYFINQFAQLKNSIRSGPLRSHQMKRILAVLKFFGVAASPVKPSIRINKLGYVLC